MYGCGQFSAARNFPELSILLQTQQGYDFPIRLGTNRFYPTTPLETLRSKLRLMAPMNQKNARLDRILHPRGQGSFDDRSSVDISYA